MSKYRYQLGEVFRRQNPLEIKQRNNPLPDTLFSDSDGDRKYFAYSNSFWKKGDQMKINKLDHISIAVKNIDQAKKVWGPVLGKSKPDVEYVDELEKIKVVRYCLGDVGFELMESTTPDGEVAKFIEKNGEGIMLLSLNVDNTREAMDELKQKNYPFIGDPRPFKGCEFAFVHPKKMNGVLLELIDFKGTEFEEDL